MVIWGAIWGLILGFMWPGHDSDVQAVIGALAGAIAGYNRAKGWLFGGNTIVRMGVLVLFAGPAFLRQVRVARQKRRGYG
jgi:hypothetical protein